MKRGAAVAATFVALAGLGVLLPLHSDAFAPDGELKSDKTCDKGPLSSPRANCAPPPLPRTGNLNDDCVARINQLRWDCQCLPPLTRWRGGEQCARKHAKYDSKRGIHGGFNKGICKPAGLAQNECPGWPSNRATNASHAALPRAPTATSGACRTFGDYGTILEDGEVVVV
jgi:hypothetical protein